MTFAVEPLTLPFDFAPRLPGSKSIAQRALLLAAQAADDGGGTTTLDHVTPSDDVAAMERGLAALGYSVARGRALPHDDGSSERVVVGARDRAIGAATLDADLAGTAARFLVALAATTPGRFTVTGRARLEERPFAELFAALRSLGAALPADAKRLPVTIEGAPLRGGHVRLDASRSSQFLSALLLIAPRCEKGLEIELTGPLASAPYVELTIDLLARFGVGVERERASFRVAPQPLCTPGTLRIEDDWSAAGAWLVLERLAGSRARMPGLAATSRQPDAALPALLDALEGDGPRTLDVAAVPDQLMNLAVVAAARRGATRFTGAANLRWKESDRVAVLARELARAGVAVEATDDGLLVTGPARLHPAALDCAGDHRMAIAFALLATLQPGLSLIGAECVTKSDPRFFEQLAAARAAPRCIALVGMRGAGKSTLAVGLAERLRLAALDADVEFERRHGPLAAFVAAHGWPRFRALESALLPELLAPGRVVALGGGAIESEANRALLRREAVVVHLDESLPTLSARLAATPRPSLTGADPQSELAEVAARRAPLYREVAAVSLAPDRSIEQRLDEAIAALTARARWPA